MQYAGLFSSDRDMRPRIGASLPGLTFFTGGAEEITSTGASMCPAGGMQN
jgi:hypothetical protein